MYIGNHWRAAAVVLQGSRKNMSAEVAMIPAIQSSIDTDNGPVMWLNVGDFAAV